jgi:hypothetical protein
LITESYQTYGERALHFRHQRFKFDIMGEGTVLLAAHPMLMGSSESKMMSVVTLQDIAHHPTNETPRALARPSGIFHAGDASDGDARPENPNVADATSADSWIGAAEAEAPAFLGYPALRKTTQLMPSFTTSTIF